jgi:hypothetical protein
MKRQSMVRLVTVVLIAAAFMVGGRMLWRLFLALHGQ